MKNILAAFLCLASLAFTNAQVKNEKSSTRKFIEDASYTQINKDWSTTAIFKSGLNETVSFFPIEVIDLKTGEKIKALQLDMFIKNPDLHKTAWVGLDEIAGFIDFIEKYVVPNLDVKLKDQSKEFVLKAREVTFSYFIYERRSRITITLNDYESDDYRNYSFWTETRTDDIPELLPVLKKII
ncbi:hypothetical protein I5168_11550 [Nonlabens sp. SCSIO 43208]|uniref:hypothetical protein n=1 Tax=Nonlabens sp. SCSIO 43208 TaxID=2793009 RepID=UPI003D6AD08E